MAQEQLRKQREGIGSSLLVDSLAGRLIKEAGIRPMRVYLSDDPASEDDIIMLTDYISVQVASDGFTYYNVSIWDRKQGKFRFYPVREDFQSLLADIRFALANEEHGD